MGLRLFKYYCTLRKNVLFFVLRNFGIILAIQLQLYKTCNLD